MSRPAGQGQFEFDKLRRLLLSAESERLSAVESLLFALDARVGAPERLEKATAEILVEAFRAAEVARHQELARAVAPVVAAAIRNEIVNSRDSMVEALYPITGRLVSAAVANAIKNLAADLNKTLDPSNVTRRWRLRFKALAKGKSVREVALAESRRPVLRRLLLLERGSGRPIATWSREADGETSELVSGMIAAITEFASSVYGAQDGELRTLDLGGSSVLLRATPLYLIAAEVDGALTGADEKAFDDAVLSIATAADRTPDKAQSALVHHAASLFPPTSEPNAQTSFKPLLGVACILALVGFWASWGFLTRTLTQNRIIGAFERAKSQNPQLGAWPLRIEIDHNARRAVIVGLAPAREDADSLVGAVAPQAAPYAVVENVAVLAGAEQTGRAIAELGQQVTTVSGDMVKSLNGLQAEIASSQAQAKESAQREARAVADVSARLERAQAELALDARDRIEKLFTRTAVFFVRELQFADPQKAEKKVAEVALAFKEAQPARVTVIGQADWSGAHDENVKLALGRAQMVRQMLVKAGVPAENLHVLARLEAPPPGENLLRDYRARRVTFQLGFEDEQAP